MMIRPMSAMQSDSKAIAAYCRKEGKPVYLTEEGEEELILMTKNRYRLELERLDLQAKLWEAEAQLKSGAKLLTMEEVQQHMRERHAADV